MFSPCDFWVARLRVVSPAPFAAVLEMGGNRGYLRRALLSQRTGNDSAACYDANGELLCVVMCKLWRARRVELALMIKPLAATRMLELIRLARMVLCQMVKRAILVFAHINPLNEAGRRMARLAGFRQGKFKDRSIWVMKR